ncbi:MAG: glycosyltransferase [Planctomycetes bacterium]|nr:glycosyltransferase [Planctomycetota bacterium]MCP4771012.1 glycosyltransferase [Planctomycetota bacterium]MCP4861731.1 glycosyltransferase [Planctomycetota bacterium]
MEILREFVYWIGIILCLPSAFLLLEVVAGMAIRPSHKANENAASEAALSPAGDAAPSAVLLIPAHNEQALLGEMLDRLKCVDRENLRTVVIADNCTDDTAKIAREAGVEVWERSHDSDRGKPYALAWALQRLEEQPPQVVVFMDADSWFQQGSPAELAREVIAHHRPVQAIYRMADAGLRGFAFRFRNEVRLRGLASLGAPVQLTGSGFAISWADLQKHPVPIGELAEDACWGWALAAAGIGPRLAAGVEVLSYLPSSKEGAQTQLRRWEHGILGATLRKLPMLLRSAFLPPRLSRIFHFADILVPPLALLVLLSFGFGLLGLLIGAGWLALPAFLALDFVASAVFLGWLWYGREDVPLSKLLMAPFYAVSKIGVYLSFLFKRQQGWQRTDRDDG